MSSVTSIRKKFLDFFEANSHKIIKSSSLVPSNDPTLMFTNAGMVQFKNIFTGQEQPKALAAATSQKCVRAGGKHNDLENVGYTARHHTFFEMLGNFSFGDYFKEKAIYYAWELLTKEFGLSKDKLYFTVYHNDDEAFSLWKKIAGASDDRIIRIDTNDNFWSMGDLGPCGPCSEIFYDHGDSIFGGLPGTKDGDGDRYIEIWNLVFMQYEQISKDERISLPKPSIDTGMGLERISAVIQNVHNNYDTDLFLALISQIQDIYSIKKSEQNISSLRVIADHIRAVSFLIADGVIPSNEGRGYVLRRIMRRAMRHAHHLNPSVQAMHKVVRALVAEMGDAYPELQSLEAMIQDTIHLEEERFSENLSRGLKLLDIDLQSISGKVFPGESAFKLYDTYGFPLDLTMDILKAKNITVDEQGFNASMERQREQSRKSFAGSGSKALDKVYFDLKNNLQTTEFLGYSQLEAQAIVQAIVVNDEIVGEQSSGKAIIITNQTPFYGESGGQIGDRGEVKGKDFLGKVVDTKKIFGEIILHEIEIVSGTIKDKMEVELRIDQDFRNKVRANHSATHLLHAVLRKALGSQVIQKGSLVTEARFRFDFSYPKALTKEQLQEIELKVNELIISNHSTRTKLMNIEEALKSGAMALFGEKYDDEVRVVSMAHIDEDEAYSVELCGGTHVKALGDIGCFKIISESSIAAGVRRIEAITGLEVIKYLQNKENITEGISSFFKVSENELSGKVASLFESNKVLEKQILSMKIKDAITLESQNIVKHNDINVIVKQISDFPLKEVKTVTDNIAVKFSRAITIIFVINEGKLSIVVAIGKDISHNYDARKIVQKISAELGGAGGGGKQDYAQAGASNVEGLNKIISNILLYCEDYNAAEKS